MEHTAAARRPNDMRAGAFAAVLLLAACAGAPADPSPDGTPPRPTPTPATATAPGPTVAPGGWRELASGMWLGEEVFAVAYAANDEQLAELWQRLDQAGPPPAVDFAHELVLFLGMSGSSTCPEVLERLVVDHAAGTVHGQWRQHDPGQPCTDDLQAQSLLLAVDRSQLPAEPFVFSLRPTPMCPDCPEPPDRTLVDPRG